MTQQGRQRLIHAVVCALSLVCIVALTVRQTSDRGGRIIGQLTGGGNNTQAELSSSPSAATSQPPKDVAAFILFKEPLPQNGSSTVFPDLFKSLTRLTQPPGTVVNLTSGPVKSGLAACKRPVAKNLAGLLSQPPSSFPYRRPPHRGGLWSPAAAGDCWPPISRTAVLVPYRNRSKNLDTFVPYMQTLPQHQGIVFGIFVIDQANAKLFNRAKLLNVGFKVSQKFGPFDCFVFQDADKVPENTASLFDCANSPKLMISEMRRQSDPKPGKYHRGRMYSSFFGGAVAVSKQAFERVNGNSNRYYGWGREDDELAARLGLRGLRIHYPGGMEARFVNLDHSHDIVVNTMPWPHSHMVRTGMDKDGLNSLSYGDKGIYLHDLFVLVRADV